MLPQLSLAKMDPYEQDIRKSKKAGRLAARSASNFEFIGLKISVEIFSRLQGVRSAVSALGRGNTPASAESPVGVQCLVEALWQMIVVLRMKLQRSLKVS